MSGGSGTLPSPSANRLVLAGGPLESTGADLAAPAEFEALINPFPALGSRLHSPPSADSSEPVAPLTRLLRGGGPRPAPDRAQADRPKASPTTLRRSMASPLTGEALLFPDADDATFADGYAQTVTFALLLARSEEIDLAAGSLHEVGKRLGEDHSLMGRALQLLTDGRGRRLPRHPGVAPARGRRGRLEAHPRRQARHIPLPVRGLPRGLRRQPAQGIRLPITRRWRS